MAGVELQNYATVHEMSNQQSEKQSFPKTNLDRLGKTGRYLQLCSFLFCTAESLFSLDHGNWQQAVPKGDSYAAAFDVEMLAEMDQITNTAWKNTCGTLPVQLQQWHPCEWQD